MNKSDWPKTLDEAVKICFLTMTPQLKQALQNTLEENLIAYHPGLGKNIREIFGLWQGNDELIKSCCTDNPDDASMVIVKRVWSELNR